MMGTWLLFSQVQKIKANKVALSQEQKNKLKSVKESLKNIYEAVQKHVETNDPKILALPDYGLILGSTTLLMEEEILNGTAEGKEIMKHAVALPPQQEQLTGAIQQEGNVVPIKKTTTFH
jgi:hypothetical protein